MNKGKLIVLEGACDGMGKSTQLEMLCNRLGNEGINVVKHHFPTYNEYQGKSVEMFLSGEYGEPITLSPYFINNLYASDRAITWNTKLKKQYENNATIILDRYATSSIIYQSMTINDIEEKKKFINYVSDYEYNKLGIKEPDMVIFLYGDYDVVSELKKTRKQIDGIENDVYERNSDYQKRIYDNAMFVANYLSWNKVKCDKNGKMRTIEDIHEEIYNLINQK